MSGRDTRWQRRDAHVRQQIRVGELLSTSMQPHRAVPFQVQASRAQRFGLWLEGFPVSGMRVEGIRVQGSGLKAQGSGFWS
eukprot:1038241-Rhodomonas_salina.1